MTLTASPAGFPGAPYSAKASTTGAWSIQLEPDVGLHMSEALEGTFTLTLSGSGSASGAIVAKDVVFGDVSDRYPHQSVFSFA